MLFDKRQRNSEGFWDIEPKDLKEKLDSRSKVKLIDVRRPDEYVGELGHIEGSEMVTLETEFQASLKNWSKDETIVFICRSGMRSGRAAMFAEAHGFKEVYNMKGGMIEWNASKLPVSYSLD